jgi:peptidoglycan/LPS O-acetylase OafA/YrhL
VLSTTTINHSSLLKFIKMKKTTIIFWVTTIIIFLMEGVIPALTSQTELAKEGIRHLGYPAYFGNMLVVFKVAGALALIIPQVPKRIKEWAYAGFAFDFIAAAVSHGSVDGIGNFQTFFPLVFLAILAASYLTYHKKLKAAASSLLRKEVSPFSKELVSA